MKVTKQGQVTIPRELRKQLGFLPETEVEFIVEGSTIRLVRKLKKPADALNAIYGRKSFVKSTDELMRMLRK